jgi:predicted GNAT family acetyltransferase
MTDNDNLGAEDIQVRHEASAQRFAARLGNKIAYLSYEVPEDDTVNYAHVYVPPEHRNRGIAAKITRFALEHAREKRLAVIPGCPYVADYVRKHPHYDDILKR